jgi:hypothetical protein
MCPSPVARKLRMNRRESPPTPLWSGCQMIDGLNNAALSSEYSCVKYDPKSCLRFSESGASVIRCSRTCSKRFRKNCCSR